ncbi:unnamed protein product [Ascophyllum nodosum]
MSMMWSVTRPASLAVLIVAAALPGLKDCTAFLAPARPLGARRMQSSRSDGDLRSPLPAVLTRMVATDIAQQQQKVEKLKFLTPETARATKAAVGTPAYVYDAATLKANAEACLAFPNAYGLTVRFAMKSLPNKAILQLFHSLGLNLDCSSGWEVERALAAGIPPESLSLSSQELPANAADLLKMGVDINACSLSQLRRLGKEAPGSSIGVRFNPGLGSGGTKSTNVGGPASSFGIWYEWADEAKDICKAGDLTVTRVHTHIGSGSDPAVWQKVSGMSLDLVRQFPDVTTLNLGGGYKTGRMSGEKSTDLQVIGAPVKGDFENFAKETGRELKLEIEPGTFLVANAGSLVCTVQDMVSTGESGYEFIKLDAGMTELLRPSLYGSVHPIVVIPEEGREDGGPTAEYVVVGHCCESGDLLTCKSESASEIEPRPLEKAEIGDLIVVEGCGAYVAGMSAKNYNSFPEAPEVLLDTSGELHVVRRRQSVEQIFENESPLPTGFF